MQTVPTTSDSPRRTRAELKQENRDLRTALAILVGAAASVPPYLLSPCADEVRADAEAVRRNMTAPRAILESFIEDDQAEREGGR